MNVEDIDRLINKYVTNANDLIDKEDFGFPMENDELCGLISLGYVLQMEMWKRIFNNEEMENFKLIKYDILL